MKAFFRLHDHRRAYLSNDVRLADIVSVGDATSAHNDWHVNVMTRDGIVYQMGTSDLRQLGKWRDELMHALELDASRHPVHPLDRPDA